MSAAEPLLSVTVLNYNYGHFLGQCLRSILSQSLTDLELIVINDCSTDDSLAVIEPFLADPRVRLVHHEHNRGFVASLAEGAELSRGRYLTVISADDWILSGEAFARQVALLERHPETAFVFTSYRHFDAGRTETSVWRGGPGSYLKDGHAAFADIALSPFLLHSGTIIRRAAYEAVGGYDTSLRYSVDCRMWLGLCHHGWVGYLDEPLYAYRRHGGNMSKHPQTLRRALAEVLAALDWSLGMFPPDRRRGLGRLRAAARRRALAAFAMDDIFAGRCRSGWHCYLVSLRLCPRETLCQKATLILLLRTLLGADGYHRLERRLSPRARPAPARLPLEVTETPWA